MSTPYQTHCGIKIKINVLRMLIITNYDQFSLKNSDSSIIDLILDHILALFFWREKKIFSWNLLRNGRYEPKIRETGQQNTTADPPSYFFNLNDLNLFLIGSLKIMDDGIWHRWPPSPLLLNIPYFLRLPFIDTEGIKHYFIELYRTISSLRNSFIVKFIAKL